MKWRRTSAPRWIRRRWPCRKCWGGARRRCAERDLAHSTGRPLSLNFARCVRFAPLPAELAHARSRAMTGADKVVCQAATLLLLFTLTTMPAKAQLAGLGGGGGGGDMMTQMAPMLEMMKAKMGKRRFAMLMQTMGPMMSGMMEGGGGGGLGGMMSGGGGLGGMIPGGFGGGIPAGFGGGGIPGGFGGGDI